MCVIINRINIMNMENLPMTKMTDLDFNRNIIQIITL